MTTYFLPPHQCPACNAATARDGAYLVCTGVACPAQGKGLVARWLNKLDIKGWGPALVEAVCAAGLVKDASDLYKLNINNVVRLTMNGRRVGDSGRVAVRNLHAKKTIPWPLFYGSLGIPTVGRSLCQKLHDAGWTESSLEAIIHDPMAVPCIAAADGWGTGRAQAFVDGWRANTSLIARLKQHVTTVEPAAKPIANTNGALTGEAFCMTGFRDANLAQALAAAGAEQKSSVSKKCTMLILKDPNSTSGKAKKARDLGLKLLGITEAWALVGGQP